MAYFENIPTISYNGNLVKNILSRSQITKNTKKQNGLYHSYTQKDGERADIISEKYYDDPYYSWLVWISNEVIDPYYDLGLSEEDFNEFIIGKYGSAEEAKKKIKYFRNNWEGDESKLTVTEFNNLDKDIKKYYNPIINVNDEILGYRRKQKTWFVNTNRIIAFNVSTNGLTAGQIVIGAGYSFEIVSVNGNSIIAKNSFGTPTGTLLGTSINVVGSVTVLFESLTSEEIGYWSAISEYQHELELNDFKKNIKLLDNRYKTIVESEIKRVLW